MHNQNICVVVVEFILALQILCLALVACMSIQLQQQQPEANIYYIKKVLF